MCGWFDVRLYQLTFLRCTPTLLAIMPWVPVQLGSDASSEDQHEALLRQLLERATPYLGRIADEQAKELEIEREIWQRLHPGKCIST
jgi:hypothetical protein